MKNKITQIGIIIGLLFSIQVSATPIKDINIVGFDIISSSTVLSYMPVQTGDEITDETSDQVVKTLFATGFFENVEVSIDDATIHVVLTENPYIKYIYVLDYSDKVIDSDSVDSALKHFGLKIGKVYNKKSLFKMIESLKQTYIDEGFYNVEMEQKIDKDLQNRIGIEVIITEGKKAKIGSMNITGSKIYSEEELLDLFEIGVADNFIINFFTEKDSYTEEELEKGLKRMSNFYSNNGYLDFSVNSVDTKLSEDKENINIDIDITEGGQYTLGNVTFSGNLKDKSTDDLLALFLLNSGEIFDRGKLINSIQKMNYLYADLGYADLNVTTTTKAITESSSIDLNLEITLNKKIYINRINIIGNTRTLDEVVRREIDVSEGSVYSSSAINKSLKKIRRLGYFSSVALKTSKIDDMPDKIDLDFVVKETKTGMVSGGISHSEEHGVSLNASIKERNLFGSGNTLKAKIQYSQNYNKLSFFFEDPYFNNKEHSINYGFFISSLDDKEVAEQSYKVNSKGLSFGYGIPLTGDARLDSKLEYSRDTITCGSKFADEYEVGQCANNKQNEVKLTLNWSENTLNNYLYPTEGRKNNVNVDLALPIADNKYIKIDAKHKSYIPLQKDLTLKLFASAGISTGYGGGEPPFYKRYFGGGSGSVRGFKRKTISPYYDNSEKAKGGNFYFLTSANIVSPVGFITNNENMRMSAFVDAGTVYEKATFDTDELRISAGLSFSYMSPVGDIGIYIAFPILKKDSDQTEDFTVYLGSEF